MGEPEGNPERGSLPRSAGVLLLNKPRGITSRDAVDHVERWVRKGKVGHAGTLDRSAEGLLPVMIGFATRLIPYLQERPKSYRVTARFDQTSETLDMDGTVRPSRPGRIPSREELTDVLKGFTGSIEQAPPVYSAIKQNGQRLSDRARRTETTDFDVEARTVTAHRIEVAAYSFPVLRLRLTCGRGFYVRSLIRDLSGALGLDGGIVTQLIRTRYGPYRLRAAVSVEEPGTWNQALRPPRSAVRHLPTVQCEGEALDRVRHGNWIERAEGDPDHRAAALDRKGRIVAILEGESHPGGTRWRPRKVFQGSRKG